MGLIGPIVLKVATPADLVRYPAQNAGTAVVLSAVVRRAQVWTTEMRWISTPAEDAIGASGHAVGDVYKGGERCRDDRRLKV